MKESSFVPFPTLTTERLTLRQLEIEDEKEIFEIRSDERISEYLDRPLYKTIDETREFIKKINDGIAENKWLYWALTLKNNPKLIGTICIWNISEDRSKAEIGFELLPDFQGRGLMQEAVAAVIEYGFKNMHLDFLEGEVDPSNFKSIALMERNGFVCDRKLKNTVIYSLAKNKKEK